MRRFAVAATAVLLLIFGAQAVLAQYGSNGTLVLSKSVAAPTSDVDVTGTGFEADSTVHITIQSVPVLLGTVTSDGSGGFTTTVTIPADFDGAHTIVATGVDPEESVLVLDAGIMVTTVPQTDTGPQAFQAGGSDAAILALAGIGIVLLTAGVLLITRRSALR
jgi:hypothetical protein